MPNYEQYKWFHAAYADATGAAQPGSFTDEGSGTENSVAAIRITSQHTGEGVVIQGRPEQLVELAREVLRVAEMVQAQTLQDTSLRRMYGLTSVEGS